MKTSPPAGNSVRPAARDPRAFLVRAALVLITAAVYWQVTGFDFVNYDDEDYVTANPIVMRGITWDGVKWAFTTNEQANWHPLTYLSLMADVAVGGGSPGTLHSTNLVLQVLNVLLLFQVLHLMTRSLWRSAFAAALFAVHPLHVESVAWIVERKDCLSTFFWLLALSAYVKYVRSPSVGRYALVLVSFALGLMSKPMVVTLPLVLLLLDFWPLGRIGLRRGEDSPRPPGGILREKIPLFAMSAAAAGVTLWAQSAGAIASFASLPIGVRLANVPVAYASYLAKTVWPVNLAPFYPHPGTSLPEWLVACCTILLAGITAAAVKTARSRPYVFFGWMWYLITLVPVIGIVQVGEQAIADRYTYVPLIGVFIAIAWMPQHITSRRAKTFAAALAVICVTVLAAAAHKQAGYWRDSVTLWKHAVAVNPANAQAHRGLGNALRNLKRHEEAIGHFRKAIEIKPDYADARVGLGAALGDLGRMVEAEAEFRTALEIDPKNETAMHNLATLLSRVGRHFEAKQYYEQVLSRKPRRVPDLVGLANSLSALGDQKEAVRLLARALHYDPNSWEAANNLSWAYATSPDPEIRTPREAVRLALEALSVKKADRAMVLDTLAAAYAANGDFDRAVSTVEESITASRKQGRQEMARDSLSRLRLYRARKAYVQP